jgi:hypothetical protein
VYYISDKYEARGHTRKLAKWQGISPNSDQHNASVILPSQREMISTVIGIKASIKSAFCYLSQESQSITKHVLNPGTPKNTKTSQE